MAVDRNRWQEIEAILDEVLELPADRQSAYLDEACGDDGDLRSGVEAMLRADEDSSTFLGTPAPEFAATLIDEGRAEARSRETSEIVGRQLGPYFVERRIGGGGMGVVYEARDTRLGRRVAVKLLPDSWSFDPAAKERFLLEARAASALDHPNICNVHDIGESSDGRLYIVMAYYEGETLDKKLRRGPLDADAARRIACAVAKGLERAHEAGITHRDIKPANVIVTRHGETKILDFGIAKIAGEVAMTRTGHSLGSPAYMAPERARGEPADERSDLWSLGALLYEMLAGERPFPGSDAQAVIYGILHRDPEPLGEVCPETPDDLAAIVTRAMARDPARRYQHAAELREALEPGTTTEIAPLVARQQRRAGAIASVVAAVVAVLLLSVGWAVRRDLSKVGSSTVAGSPPGTSRTSLAVLYFQNLTGDPELDWLRRGVTDLLVTDLAQSSDFDVLSTTRLYTVLEGLDAVEETTPSLDLIRQVAEQAAVNTVVLGSFARAGELIRFTCSVETAATGDRLKSAQAEGRGAESLFSTVDSLSAAIRGAFERRTPAERPKTVEAVTTSSLSAWRYYSESLDLHDRSKRTEAVVLLEAAIETDPTFALALAKLSRLQRNLGDMAKSAEYARRAAELADRLPLDQRFEVEGSYYGARWSTLDRAVDAYREGLRLYPDHERMRANLASRYAELERYEEALAEYRTLIDAGATHQGVYSGFANVSGGLGRFRTGYRALADYVERHPDNWGSRTGMGWFLTDWGKPEEALAQLDKAAILRPGNVFVHYGRWRAEAVRGDWLQAEHETGRMLEVEGSLALWRGTVSRARNATYLGRTEEALRLFDEALTAFPDTDATKALTHCWKAELLLQRGEPARALAEAELARQRGQEEWPELQGLFLAAVALEGLGRADEADRLRDVLDARAEAHGNVVERRLVHYLDGLLALARGEAEAAATALGQAESLLPPVGVEVHWHVYPLHVPIRFDLGRAELAAGRVDAAIDAFRKAAASGSEHLESPVPYVRSHYSLGRLLQQRGDVEEGRAYFERFLDFWRGGDLDRARVEKALAALGE